MATAWAIDSLSSNVGGRNDDSTKTQANPESLNKKPSVKRSETTNLASQSLEALQILAKALEQMKQLREADQTISLMRELDSLAVSEDIEAVPTAYAHFQAKSNIESAYNSIFVKKATDSSLDRHSAIPSPVVTTDDVGGIMMVWESPLGKSVVANFGAGPNLKSFIYTSFGGHRESVTMNELNLRRKLTWLAER